MGLHHLVFGSISSLSLEVAGGARDSGTVTGWLQAGEVQSGQVSWWLRDREVKGQEVERPGDRETARRGLIADSETVTRTPEVTQMNPSPLARE